MKTKASSAECYVWGAPDKKPDNSGYARWILFLAVVFISIASACFHWSEILLVVRPPSSPGAEDGFNGWMWWGIIELIIAYFLCIVAFLSHFRLDGILANSEGIDVAYSHIPEFAGDFINERVLVPWGDVFTIKSEDDGEGSYSVGIALKGSVVNCKNSFNLSCANEFESHRVCNKLQRLAGHLDEGPRN